MKSFNIELNKNEIEMLLSSLLFISSINVVLSEDIDNHSEEFISLAKKIKSSLSENKAILKYIKFVHDKNESVLEDTWTQEILNTFNKNLQTIELESV